MQQKGNRLFVDVILLQHFNESGIFLREAQKMGIHGQAPLIFRVQCRLDEFLSKFLFTALYIVINLSNCKAINKNQPMFSLIRVKYYYIINGRLG